jgi:hypothetical protein
LRDLLEQFHNQPDLAKTLSELRRDVKRYEERYGLSSDCIGDAIEAGELIGDRDVGRLLGRVEGK